MRRDSANYCGGGGGRPIPIPIPLATSPEAEVPESLISVFHVCQTGTGWGDADEHSRDVALGLGQRWNEGTRGGGAEGELSMCAERFCRGKNSFSEEEARNAGGLFCT